MKMCGACIITDDVIRLVNFYKEVLKTQPLGNATHSSFEGMQLAIWNPGNVQISKTKNMSLMYYVEDINKEHKRLCLISGLKELSKPVVEPWGVTAFTFKDPDGNEVNFLEQQKQKI